MLSKLLLVVFILHSLLLNSGYKFIFTGGPCCGKTTVIKELQKMGYQVCPEAYSALYRAAKINGTLEKFCSDMLYQRHLIMQRHLEQESRLDLNKPAFLDRSIPDVIFYGNYFNVKMSMDLLQKFAEHKADYAIVFFFEPVPAVFYQSTDVRSETRVEALKIHQALLAGYVQHDFNIIHVPFDSIEKRVDFILDKVRPYCALSSL